MVLYEPQELGGLEEYAVTLAIGLHQRGHDLSVVSTTWTPATNQYLRRLREHGVTVVQVPKWLSRPASNWATKQKILDAVTGLTAPLIYGLACGLCLVRGTSWQQALISAQGWLRGHLLRWLIGPDRREPLARMLLSWWQWRWKPDLLHIQGYTKTLLFAIEWAHAKGIPVVYEEHQTPDAQFNWWQGFQQTINKAEIVVAVSETSAQALRTVCGVTQPIVVRNPLLPDPLATGWQRQAQVHQPNAPVRITTVARLSVAKGLNYLLDAIKVVKQQHPTTEFRVYGEGDLHQDLLNYAAQLGLDGQAIFVGPFTSRDELADIMAATDIFVMSSILEGQPLAMVEAMAYGCPIVTTAVGGIPELIQSGTNGLLCQPKDPACLAANIRALIEDPELRRRLGQAARQSYEQGPYQPAALCEHFVAIYEEALRSSQQPSQATANLAPSFKG